MEKRESKLEEEKWEESGLKMAQIEGVWRRLEAYL